MIAFLAVSALAAPVFGVRYAPFGRGDLAWVADERTSGRAVGEFDGFVAPPLQAYAGAWTRGRWGVFGALGMARLTTTQWTGDVWRQRHWSVLRPSVDVRWGAKERELRAPLLYVSVVGHGDIPGARDTSNGYDADEQVAADEAAAIERYRLGGFGAGAGAGVDWRVDESITIGASWTLGAHVGTLRSSESTTTSSWVVAETALHLAFEWPPRSDAPG